MAWWQRAARLERLLEQLPAPPAPADKKGVMLDQLTAAGPVIKSVPSDRRDPVPSPGTAFLKRVGKYMAALAAAVLVVVGGWRLIPKNGTHKQPDVAATPRHPLLDNVVKRDVALAKADTPAKRLEVLGELAEDLSAEARGLARAAKPDELDDLSRWYEKVVGDGIVRQAAALEKLPVHPIGRAEKAAVYGKLAGQLAAAARDAEALKKEAPPGSHKALDEIAKAAQDGQARLVKLADAAPAAAAARGPGPLAADDLVKLFRANRVLLGSLVERGVELGQTDDPAARAEACQKAAHALAVSLEDADDPARAAEIGDHLETVVRDGLLPNLEDGFRLYPQGSPPARKLADYRQAATGDLVALGAKLDERPKVSTDAKVKDLRARLDALKDKLK
jgi:hypothetical protein